MNLNKLAKMIDKEWRRLGFEVKSNDGNKLVMTCDIVAKNYFDDEVFCKVIAYNDGTVHVFFTFDKLDKTMESYLLLNEFNNNSSWFSAYISDINDNNFLQLHYAGISDDNEKDILNIVSFMLNNILADDTMRYLKPLTKLTY